ncbi:TPA: hypothetical protein ACXEW6_000627 [Enterobacter hormaechei]|uniref:hypothetical protein n=1 Tax=Enterobacter hormaechei TaxID=158836 RepID=UPI0039C4BBE5
MSNIDKQAGEGDVSPKTYYIHPMAFGGTQNPGYGHVPVVHVEDFEKQRAKLEAAEKRIAELEEREVREDGNQFLVVRYPGKAPVIKHCAGDLEGFLRQLLEHDPMATIDIVTHRYYGVGGQWVQDADEYLQMMAAAAGKGEAS